MNKKNILFILIVLLGLQSNLCADNWENGSLSETGGFERYVPPITNPFFNETPYITNEIRIDYFHQWLPDSAFSGGNINMPNLQFRLALTDRLGFIFTKGGFIDIDFDAGPVDVEGFSNIAAGFKYALYANPEDDLIHTLGIKYEFPIGDIETGGVHFQGRGEGVVDLFMSSAKNWEKLGLQTNMGINLPIDNDDNTTQLHYSLHFDYEIFPNFYPLIEFNGFTTIDEGDKVAFNLEGHDVLNFGAISSGTTISAAAGFRYKFNDNILVGVAWEETITGREDLMDSRITADFIYLF